MGNQHRAFVSFDTILAVLPVMLLLVYTIKTAASVSNVTGDYAEKQKKFDKLVSAAEYLVNYGLTKKDNGKYYPNWVMGIEPNVIEKVRNASGLTTMRVGFENSGGTCVYRLVVYGENKEIRKLYVCAD